MTREEEMMEAAEAHAACCYADEPVCFSTEENKAETICDFIAGWKGADKSFIDKACEWLENNAYLYVEETDSLRESALIGDFRAAMKGGEQ